MQFMLILYLAFLLIALLGVAKILLPEIKESPVTRILPRANPSSDGSVERIARLETLLAEKSKNIQVLQTELKIFQIEVRESDKVKALLEEEIYRLREQNRIFRSELGLPAVQLKENSIK
jgi:hypothetical protein